MMFNATINKISVISWRSVLLVKETAGLSQVTDKSYYIKLYQIHLAMNDVKTHSLMVIGIDCTGSCKSNYHTITSTTAPIYMKVKECCHDSCAELL